MMKIILSFFAVMIALTGIMFTVPRAQALENEQAIFLLFLGGSKGRGAEITSHVTPSEIEVAGVKKWLAWVVLI